MRRYRGATVLISLLQACSLFAAPQRNDAKDAPKDDGAKLKGTWVVQSFQFGGQLVKLDKKVTVAFDADGYAVQVDGQTVERGTQKLNDSKTPKEIDWTVVEGQLQGKTQLGIYEINGDDLKICMAWPANPRPGEFSAPAGTLRKFLVLKRQTR
jgi:uncharacterized protein (TIGR03067 family)